MYNFKHSNQYPQSCRKITLRSPTEVVHPSRRTVDLVPAEDCILERKKSCTGINVSSFLHITAVGEHTLASSCI